jgi:hypothetical protein
MESALDPREAVPYLLSRSTHYAGGDLAIRGAGAAVVAAGWLIALAPGSAWADSTEAPRVEHTPVVQCVQGDPFFVRAHIYSPVGIEIFQPTIYVRVAGVPTFAKLPMKPEAGLTELYVGRIPGALTQGDFDYYIEAYDTQGNGPSRSGAPDVPIHVTAKAKEKPPLVAGASGVAKPSAGSAPAAAVHVEEGGSPRRTIGFVLGGVGVAAIAGGAVFGVLSLGTISTEKAASTNGDLAGYDAAKSTAHTQQHVADGLYAGGAALGIAGLILVLTAGGRSESTVSVGVAPSPGGASALIRGAF